MEVDALAVAVDGQDHRQAHADFGGSNGDDEQGKHFARYGSIECGFRVAVEGAEGDEVDVHRVEDELDRHQHQHGVAACEHAVDTNAEEDA